jgi:hypothetical protein
MSIIGDNFRARPGARCIFGDIVTALTFKDSETAVCTSPPSKLKIRHMVNLTIMFSEDDIANLQPGFLCPEFTQPTPSNRCTPYQRRVDRFYYYINPTVTKVTPHSGPVTGGTAITLEGTGFYPELFSISSCYFGSSTFQSALPNQLGPLPLAPNVTNYITTLTQVVCTVTKPAEAGLKNMYFSMNSQQSAVISPIPGYKDRKTQRFAARFTRLALLPFSSCARTAHALRPADSRCFQPASSSTQFRVSTASCPRERPLTSQTKEQSQCNTFISR